MKLRNQRKVDVCEFLRGGIDMDVIETLQARRCARAFMQKPVDKELLLKVLDAANKPRLMPTVSPGRSLSLPGIPWKHSE
jgi:hypothetical protein